MTELLLNYLGGRWQAGARSDTPLIDLMPVAELVGVNATRLVDTALQTSWAI